MSKNKKPALTQLGSLESDVIRVVWDISEATVQQVKDILEPNRQLAYTTVMTVMSRLAEKGLLNRRKEGRAYVYTSGTSQEKVAGSLLKSLVDRLFDGATDKAIAHLLENDEQVDEDELDRLERLIQAKRKKR